MVKNKGKEREEKEKILQYLEGETDILQHNGCHYPQTHKATINLTSPTVNCQKTSQDDNRYSSYIHHVSLHTLESGYHNDIWIEGLMIDLIFRISWK